MKTGNTGAPVSAARRATPGVVLAEQDIDERGHAPGQPEARKDVLLFEPLVIVVDEIAHDLGRTGQHGRVEILVGGEPGDGCVVVMEANLARGMVEGIDLREQNIESLEELRRGSLDFYARLRSVWLQRRDAQLGRAADAEDRGPAVLDDPAAAARTDEAPQPRISSPVRRRSSATSRSAPPSRSRAVNSERREASSLMVPVRYTSTMRQRPPGSAGRSR